MNVPTAPYGPVGTFTTDSVGKHSHWDVHGPYKVDGRVDGAWSDLWKLDDAMFHSETGCPSTSSAELIRRFKGDLKAVPGTHSNPLWNRQPWWVDWPTFIQETGHEPASLEEFVDWSQKRQSTRSPSRFRPQRGDFPRAAESFYGWGTTASPNRAMSSKQ